MKARNSALLVASRFVGSALGFFTLPLLLKWVGKEAYGVLLYSFTIQTYVGLVDVGFTLGAQKYTIEALLDNDHERVVRIQRCQSFLCLLTGFAGWFVYFILAFALMSHFSVLTHAQTFTIFFLAGASFIAAIYGQVLTTTAVAYDRYSALTIATTAKDIVQNAILIYLGWHYRSVTMLAWGYAIGTVLGLAVLYGLLRLAKAPIYVKPLADWPLIREISTIGVRNYPNNVVGNLANRSDKVILGLAESRVSVFADYSFATKPIELLYDLMRPALITITAEITRDLKKSQEAAATAQYRNGLIMWTLGCCAMVPTTAVGDAFLRAWLHNGGVEYGGIIMGLMGFYYASEFHNLCLATLFNAKGTPHRLIGFAAGNALATVILTIPMYRWLGLPGVALMNAVIEVVQWPFRIWITTKEFDVPFPAVEYGIRCAGVLAVCIGTLLLGRMAMGTAALTHSKFAFLPVGALLLAVSVTLCFGLKITPMPYFLKKYLGGRIGPVEAA
jgi:O-antigen/teichoic acid export membrane protein